MTIRHLKIFIEVAETGKMSAAAERCYLSQPTVSQAIHELEKHYGVLLFERLSKKLYITEAGKNLLLYARQLINQYELLEENMKKNAQRDLIRIGATITVGTCLLSSLIDDLKTAQADLDIYSFVDNTHVIEEKLLNSELDVGIVEGHIHHPDLICEPMVDDFLVLACSPDHPLSSRKHISVADLENYSFVVREPGSGTRALFERYMTVHRTPFTIASEATCPETIRQLILRNGYLSVISVRLLEEDIRSGNIHIIRNEDHEWDRSFYFVYHKSKKYTPAMQTLYHILETYKEPDFLDPQDASTITGSLPRNPYASSL